MYIYMVSQWLLVYRPRTRGESLPDVCLQNVNAKASMGSLSSIACFAQTTFSIFAVVLEIAHTKIKG